MFMNNVLMEMHAHVMNGICVCEHVHMLVHMRNHVGDAIKFILFVHTNMLCVVVINLLQSINKILHTPH